MELVGGHQARLEFATNGAQAAILQPQAPARMRPSPLEPRVSEAEREAHRAFVASLGEDALWLRYA